MQQRKGAMQAVTQRTFLLGSRTHILVVADEPRAGNFLKTGLTGSGHVVGLAQEFAYDTVVLDVMTPQMNDWQVLAKLREQSDIPVIFLTACGELQSHVKSIDPGARDYLVKPFSFAA